MAQAARILRISRTVADVSRAAAFYCGALGFVAGYVHPLGSDMLQALGLSGTQGRSCILALGQQQIELTEFDPPGRPYPAGSTAASPWFQHCAIVVRDVAAAYGHLREHGGFTPISCDGPQVLPRSSGGVSAFKFRDPDGHPLELLQFPPDATPDMWRAHAPGVLRLGIDHSAIVVREERTSLAFYTGQLGMRIAARSHNAGPAQQRLDGLPGADLDVIALDPPGGSPPHLELLAYRVPQPGPGHPAAVNDIASTRLVIEAGAVAPAGRSAPSMLRDPDGHALLLLPGAANRRQGET